MLDAGDRKMKVALRKKNELKLAFFRVCSLHIVPEIAVPKIPSPPPQNPKLRTTPRIKIHLEHFFSIFLKQFFFKLSLLFQNFWQQTCNKFSSLQNKFLKILFSKLIFSKFKWLSKIGTYMEKKYRTQKHGFLVVR